jgi:ABC-type lipoprotein release transport system permease subunit
MKIPLSYSWRSIWQRRMTTVLTLGGIALVVFVFAAVLMLANGLEETLVETGAESNVLVLRRSATTELVSQINRNSANIIKTHPEVKQLPDGKPLASTELNVIINLTRQGSKDMGNVSVRGISPEGIQLRPHLSLTSGRMFAFGTNEIIVGKSIADKFQDVELGNQLRFGDAQWTIVGFFDTRGTAFESEIWGDVEQLMPAFGRPVFSVVLFQLRESDDFESVKTRIESDPRTQSSVAKREIDYYRETSATMSMFIKVLGLIVTIIFSVGATIGAMITMYAAVANRTVEIGTLRAIGFRRRSILGAFLIESIVLAIVGGSAGIVLASLTSLIRISTINFSTFSELAFGFVLSPGIVIASLVFAVIMGILGGFLPAARAARMQIVSALRSS